MLGEGGRMCIGAYVRMESAHVRRGRGDDMFKCL